MRIQLDIPASEMAQAVKVIAWGQKVLRVTIEPEDFSKVLSAPKGVYLQPQQIKIVGWYTIIEQKERPG